MALDDEDVRDVAKATPRDGTLRRERAPARDDDDFRAGGVERRHDARRNRVIVMEHALGPGEPHAAKEDRPMLRLHAPGAARNGVRRVDDREIDLRESGNAVEERSAVRRRLREDGRHPDRRRLRRCGECPEEVDRSVARASRDGSSASPPHGGVGREERIEPHRLGEHAGRRPTRPAREAGERARCRGADCRKLVLEHDVDGLEDAFELDESRGRIFDIGGIRRNAEPDLPSKPGAALGESRCEGRDLPERDFLCMRSLQVAAPPRRLVRVKTVEHERLLDAVAVADVEHARPEVVVLGFAV